MKRILAEHIIPFFKNLFAANGVVEHKIIVGLICTILWCIGWCYHLYSHVNIQVELVYTNALIIGACFGLDVVNSIKMQPSKLTETTSETTNEKTKTTEEIKG